MRQVVGKVAFGVEEHSATVGVHKWGAWSKARDEQIPTKLRFGDDTARAHVIQSGIGRGPPKLGVVHLTDTTAAWNPMPSREGRNCC